MWVLWDRIKARCSAAVIFDFMEAYMLFSLSMCRKNEASRSSGAVLTQLCACNVAANVALQTPSSVINPPNGDRITAVKQHQRRESRAQDGMCRQCSSTRPGL